MSFDGRSGLTCSNCSAQFFFCPWFTGDFFPSGSIVRVCPEAALFLVSCPVTQPCRPLMSVFIGLAFYHPGRSYLGHALQHGLHSAHFASDCFSGDHFPRPSLLPAAGQPRPEQPPFPPSFCIIYFISSRCPPPATLTEGLKVDFGAAL